MHRVWLFTFALILALAIIWGTVFLRESGFAAKEATRRQTEITVSYTEYEWWLLRWSDNELVCQLYIEHDGLPTGAEVFKACGYEKYLEWMQTGPCLVLDKEGDTSTCPGLYAHFISSEIKQKTITIDLPLPTVWVTISGCEQKPLNNYCNQMPSLLLIAEEPLPNEHPVAIHGILGGKRFSCPAATCLVPLRRTTSKGAIVEFWMDSSYGDSSRHYQAKVRVLDAKTVDTKNKDKTGYYVDLLSSQWRGLEQINGCSECWQSFPSPGMTVEWLANPQEKENLSSNEPFVYLAGRLILAGFVEAKDCPNNGIYANGWANACGLEKARNKLKEWQNRFNQEIINASKESGIPSQLLKNVIAQETQFWPSAVLDMETHEVGFGRQTELGSDVILLYNEDFYRKFCPLVLDQSVCNAGYVFLTADQQKMLRGALLSSANLDCPSCEGGINTAKASLSIRIVAQMLLANCRQTGAMISTISGDTPAEIASYEDLWKFTLTSYHAGAGCFLKAFTNLWNSQQKINWSNFSTYLDPGCQTARQFVDRVVKPAIYIVDELPLEPFPTIDPDKRITTTASAEPLITQTASPTPTIEATITPTEKLPQPTITPLPTSTNTPTTPPTITETPQDTETPTP